MIQLFIMSSDKGINWQVENTLTYDKTIGKHSFAVVLAELFDSDFAELSPPAAPLLSDDVFPHPATIAATIAPTSNKLIAFFFMFTFPFFLFNDFSLSFNSCCS